MRIPGWAQYLAVLGAAFAVGSVAGNLRGCLAPPPAARPDRPPPAPSAAAVAPPAPLPAPAPATPAPGVMAGRTQTPGGTLPRRPAPAAGAAPARPGASDRADPRIKARMRAQVLAAFPALQKLVAPCAGPGSPGAGLPTVELQLETRDGEVWVTEALPQPPGAAADPRAVCAAEALRGATVPAPAAVAGTTLRLPFTLASGGSHP